jgi:cell division protease FtsH
MGRDEPAASEQRPGDRPGYDPRLGCGRLLVWTILFIGIYALLGRLLGPAQDGQDLAYSAFRAEVEEGNVLSVEMRGLLVAGVLREPLVLVEGADTSRITEFVTHVPSVGDDELMPLLEANDVEVWTLPEPDTSWLQILVWGLLPMVVLGVVLFLFARGMAGRAQSLLSIGKSGAREYKREESVVTFDDVAGASGAKRELREIVAFLKNPAKFHRLGAEVPKGVLLVGPPGTGKTLLARAVAGEAHVSFFIITGSDFMEMFVGVGAKRVRNLFEKAKDAAPSIIFIDELDSIGRHRGAGLGGGHDEREQTLNQLLSALDGFEPTESVIVMAATNRPDILDPALLRPGRFDRRIAVGLPTASERLDILRLHARKMRLARDVDLDPIASGTPGFSGADLKNLLNEAALIAARRDGDRISAADLDDARDRILLGLKREGLALTDDEKGLLAYHEAGHALLAATLPSADPVHKVTIIPRGRSMGSTHQRPERDRFLWRRDELLDHLAMVLGGRAAEELVFDTLTSGAEDDLHRATRLARRMVLRWGMSPALGPFSVGSQDEQVFLGEQIGRAPDHSEATAETADAEVRRLLEAAASKAVATLNEHRDVLDAVADALLEREEITGAEVVELLERERAVEGVSG